MASKKPSSWSPADALFVISSLEFCFPLLVTKLLQRVHSTYALPDQPALGITTVWNFYVRRLMSLRPVVRDWVVLANRSLLSLCKNLQVKLIITSNTKLAIIWFDILLKVAGLAIVLLLLTLPCDEA